jgi:protein SCO1
MQVYSADKDLHSGAFLIGNPSTDTWKRVAGTTSPARLAAAMNELAAAESAAAQYFPDLPLVDQNGTTHRFYSDLVKGRIVVINTFFTECAAVCPMTLQHLAKVQAQFGDRVGKDVFLYSITVDPLNDTPKKLQSYAKRYGANNGWQFLTGKQDDVAQVLKKLGQFVDNRDAHSSLFIIGNEPTGLWKKANGLADADEIAEVIASVMNDGR